MTTSPPPPPPTSREGHAAGQPPVNAGSVHNLDWAILGAGALALLFSFFSYYTASVSFRGIGGASVSINAWHGFFGWFAMLCAVAGSAAVALALFAPRVKLPVPARPAGLGLYAVATLCVILALFIVPGGRYSGPGVDTGHGFGYWASLIVILAGLVLSLMRLQQRGERLPGALAKLPNIGGTTG